MWGEETQQIASMAVESVVVCFPACESITRRATTSRTQADKQGIKHFQVCLLSDACHLIAWAEAGQAESLLTLSPLGFGTVVWWFSGTLHWLIKINFSAWQ